MKFSIAVISSLVAAAAAATLPTKFTLVAEGGSTIVTDGGSLYAGADYNDTLILTGPGPAVSYTAVGQTPTGWQNLYIVPGASEPAGLTPPHSGMMAWGANMSGFGVSDDGYFTFGGEQYWGKDPATDKVYWVGLANMDKFAEISLWVKECVGC